MGNLGKIVPFLAVLAATSAACVGQPVSYALFAENARDDADVESVPSIRIPLGPPQPTGARIFCGGGDVLVTAEKVDMFTIKIRDPDGRVRTLETPHDGIPVGLPIFWPQGRAERCGIVPDSPEGTVAYVLWREFFLGIVKDQGPGKTSYLLGDRRLVLSSPLTDNDRRTLLDNAVPERVVVFLY